MQNERREIVTGVMVVMMAGVMIFGILFIHGGQGDHRDGNSKEQKQYSDTDHHHVHDSVLERDSVPADDEKK